MGSVITEIVGLEISSLIEQGWSDFPSQIDGLRVASEMQDSSVSFPHEFYDCDVGNEELQSLWVKWRASQILRIMKDNDLKCLWEVGSGHGNVAIPLQQENVAVIGIEPLFNGAVITSKNGVRTYLGTLESLNLPSNSISAIGAFDVLEHIKEPGDLLSEIYRVLKPGGILLISVPAHQWLFSNFDYSIGHFRRYSKLVLSQSLDESGFINIKTEFMFSAFMLPALILRKFPTLLGRNHDCKESFRSSKNQIKMVNALTPILIPLLKLERLIRFPFGLSLFSVSKR